MIDHRARFREVAEFLRRCRERTTPEQVGLMAGRRQRLRGLRREQVAQLAGISETWYARLEQGRQRGVSGQVLHSVADALGLEPVEREYLLALAGDTRAGPLPSDDTLAALRRFVQALGPMPGLAIGPRWDILAWNHAASLLFGEIGDLPVDRRNVLWLVFAHPTLAQMLDDWQAQARATLAQFRLSWARHLDEPPFAELIEALSAESAEFASWWAEHDVRPRLARRRVYCHPIVGRLELELHIFRVFDGSELWQVVFAPVSGTDTRDRLRRLLDGSCVGLLIALGAALVGRAPLC